MIVLEDLGPSGPLTGLYDGQSLAENDADEMAAYLVALHGVPGSACVWDTRH